jgi:hypothetical protein
VNHSTRVWEGALLTARFLARREEKQILLARLRLQDDMSFRAERVSAFGCGPAQFSSKNLCEMC